MIKKLNSNEHIKLRSILIEARKAKKLNQIQLDELLKMQQPFISMYETGERRLDILEFLEICKTLDLNYIEVINAVKEAKKS